MDRWKGGGQTDRHASRRMCVHPWPSWHVTGCVVRGLAGRWTPTPDPGRPRSAAVTEVATPRAAFVRVSVLRRSSAPRLQPLGSLLGI